MNEESSFVVFGEFCSLFLKGSGLNFEDGIGSLVFEAGWTDLLLSLEEKLAFFSKGCELGFSLASVRLVFDLGCVAMVAIDGVAWGLGSGV